MYETKHDWIVISLGILTKKAPQLALKGSRTLNPSRTEKQFSTSYDASLSKPDFGNSLFLTLATLDRTNRRVYF
ncbi:hypothetical protein GCM10010967_58040 [Dyadobacter beijingensis]|uniref:Uncharacterized protein n=1 Tax=Dyadobacter beijingensis TaxID=365489 RepID=A0ABQ2IMW1_9BACT|nr:hypothetical protein GCM10010967_58040 [Dyadobacter beijingensis]